MKILYRNLNKYNNNLNGENMRNQIDQKSPVC